MPVVERILPKLVALCSRFQLVCIQFESLSVAPFIVVNRFLVDVFEIVTVTGQSIA